MSQEVLMKKSRFTETLIVSILKKADAGRTVQDNAVYLGKTGKFSRHGTCSTRDPWRTG